ncbi:MAG: polyphosphate:AMP phosphotransferase [Casimicrobiaceae bacterium]
MLESAEVGHRITKDAYRAEEPRLRESLLNAQFDLAQRGCGPVLVILSGVGGGGRTETAHELTGWMDPRHLRVVAFGDPACEEKVRPRQWRYWRNLPPTGRIAIFMDGWYSGLVDARLGGRCSAKDTELGLQGIRQFEQMLASEGIVLLKFWIHLSRASQKTRLAQLTADPRTQWRVRPEDRRFQQRYRKAREISEALLRETSTATAPWCVVEGTDERYRNLTIGKVLLDTLVRALHRDAPASPMTTAASPAPTVVDNTRLLRTLDLGQKLSEAVYERELARWQGRLDALTRHRHFAKRALVAVFEGVDAAGKGGAIRRITGALDPRCYVVVPIAAPTDEELAHPYLWRFWRHVPARGGVTIFDRSWYGRVLVERVEGLAPPGDWLRAYDEINQFEEALADAGIVVVKFWMQISKEEQLRRFRAREKTPHKQFKITADDWRNRKKWPAYEKAVADMVDRTSTEVAPWVLVEGEDKRHARVKVLKTLVTRLEAAFDR